MKKKIRHFFRIFEKKKIAPPPKKKGVTEVKLFCLDKNVVKVLQGKEIS